MAATYEYDWRGLRTKKVTNSKTELYYYTGNDLIYITDQNNKLKYYFVRDLGGGLHQMIDYTGVTPKSYIYILDVHGSVIGLADNTGIVVSYEYDAWGNLLNPIQGNAVTGNGEPLSDANPFRYSGYQFDKETGFYYLKYRYYVPSLGRFLTTDPVISYNRYLYCQNNPISFVDPLGLFMIPIMLAGALIGGFVSAGANLAAQAFSSEEINWWDVGSSFLTGAAVGALMTTPLGATAWGTIALNAAGSAIFQGLHNLSTNNKFTKDMASSALIGGLSAYFIGGAYTRTKSYYSGPLPFSEITAIDKFSSKLVDEKALTDVIANTAGARSIASTVGSGVVGDLTSRAINWITKQSEWSSPHMPDYKIRQLYGKHGELEY